MINSMLKVKKIFLLFTVFNFIYFISFFIPKKKNLWVFGAWFGKKYADNSRYLFEYVLKNRPDIQAVWLTDSEQVFAQLTSQGYDVRYKQSFRGYFAAMRSTYQMVCCSLNDVFLYGYQPARSHVIQLWHGIPIKKVLMNDENFVKKHTGFLYNIRTLLLPGSKVFFHTVFAPSDYIHDLYEKKTFKGLTNHVINMGQARSDTLIKNVNHHSGVKKILYAPTHRYNKSDIDSGFSAYQAVLPSPQELDEIHQLCHEHGYEFILRLHPYAEKYLSLLNLDAYPCIKKSTAEDINQDLIDSDLLITDISSCIFDYALLDKTLLICFPDFQVYEANHRDLYYPPNTLLDDDFIFYSWRTCINYLRKMLASGDFPKNMKNIAMKYNECSLSGESCKKIVSFLTEK